MGEARRRGSLRHRINEAEFFKSEQERLDAWLYKNRRRMPKSLCYKKAVTFACLAYLYGNF